MSSFGHMIGQKKEAFCALRKSGLRFLECSRSKSYHLQNAKARAMSQHWSRKQKRGRERSWEQSHRTLGLNTKLGYMLRSVIRRHICLVQCDTLGLRRGLSSWTGCGRVGACVAREQSSAPVADLECTWVTGVR